MITSKEKCKNGSCALKLCVKYNGWRKKGEAPKAKTVIRMITMWVSYGNIHYELLQLKEHLLSLLEGIDQKGRCCDPF